MRFHVDWKLMATAILLLMILAMVFVMLVPMMEIEKNSTEKQVEAMYESIERALSECYALEGEYPPTLGYLEQFHGLKLNHDLFDFYYDNHGVSNFFPEFYVTLKEVRS